MTADQVTYLVFGIVLLVAVTLDLGLLSRRSSEVGWQKALYQTFFWVALALAFFVFVLFYEGHVFAFEYLSAYLMEWSLSIDNIFIFILIFSYFNIRPNHVPRALLIGILLAIFLRIIFISLGVTLVNRFYWILYIFGVFLVYTGIRIFAVRQEASFDPIRNPIYKLITKFLPVIHEDVKGKMLVRRNGKWMFTNLFIVVILLATADVVFALDSIPAAFAISTDRLVIYTSNIFAVLGLRSLFFLLRNAVTRFVFLQQGIAIVLIFIGLKMLAEYFGIEIPALISLLVILICLSGSIAYSMHIHKGKLGK